jgi:glycerophosphoryl diester phosphodiesterase
MHSHGMKVYAWTFRNEWEYLSWDYGQDAYVEYETFLELGLDGFFSDFPATLKRFFNVKEMEVKLEHVT